jgi:hypothetical protein
MHICYPYYEELIAVAKHWTNAFVDMCWSWIINPIAAKDFLKKYLMTAPANKLLTFGGDYLYVEQVLGHAAIARRGIAIALSELVEEGWLSLDDALALVDPIMHANARRIFRLAEKEKTLSAVPCENAKKGEQLFSGQRRCHVTRVEHHIPTARPTAAEPEAIPKTARARPCFAG